MRFIAYTDNCDPLSVCFRDSVASSIATDFLSIPVSFEKRDILVRSFLLELYEVLGGIVPFPGRNGPIYVVLTLNPENSGVDNICTGDFDTQHVTDHDFFDEAQVDLLFHVVDLLDSRFVYLGWTQDYMIRTISAIALGICRILDGSAVIQSTNSRIKPSLYFSRTFSITEAINLGRSSWMQQYVAGVVPKHFADVDQSP